MDERMPERMVAVEDGMAERASHWQPVAGQLLSYGALRSAIEARIIVEKILGTDGPISSVLLTHVFEELDLDAFEASLREKLASPKATEARS